ncbi:hypothetical protein SSPSH_001475 [Salinisphaera shabanensis E1L3A]|uniref:Uncharacterized protein n=1 Tax=Salinisphaera shabanensis E1L3A TaxID=1033802 RepID=F7QD74_9GAMM|nr:hypothetical protein SSPSH_001475 [Salinisphaera shabanensis E1L3A]
MALWTTETGQYQTCGALARAVALDVVPLMIQRIARTGLCMASIVKELSASLGSQADLAFISSSG